MLANAIAEECPINAMMTELFSFFSSPEATNHFKSNNVKNLLLLKSLLFHDYFTFDSINRFILNFKIIIHIKRKFIMIHYN